MAVEKTCKRCGAMKPLIDFRTHAEMKSGYLNVCLVCESKAAAARYRKNVEHAREVGKRYQASEAGRAARERKYERNKREVMHKLRARRTVNNHILNGRICRQPCEICGETKTDAHHDDYTKPLDVRWLCRRHHLEHHGKETYASAV